MIGGTAPGAPAKRRRAPARNPPPGSGARAARRGPLRTAAAPRLGAGFRSRLRPPREHLAGPAPVPLETRGRQGCPASEQSPAIRNPAIRIKCENPTSSSRCFHAASVILGRDSPQISCAPGAAMWQRRGILCYINLYHSMIRYVV